MNPNYTASSGRKFGLTVGIAFAVIATVSFWRGHHTAPRISGAIALALVLAALAAPRALEPVERAWMKLAHLISRVTTPIFMGIVYFAVLTPIGIVRRTFGRNPLVHEPDGGSYWIARTPVERERKRIRMERQF
jgi:tellurite resistance protein TehA-like permease